MDSNCRSEPVQEISVSNERKDSITLGLTVWGMGYINCATRVRNALLTLAGVVEAEVDHITGVAFVKYSPALVSIPSLSRAIAQAGDHHRHKYVAMFIEETPRPRRTR